MTLDEAIKEIESMFPKQILFTNYETGKILHKSAITIDRWRKKGVGPTPTENGEDKYMFARLDIAKYMSRGEIKTA